MARPFSRPRYVSQDPNRSEDGNALLASGYKLRAADADTMRRLAQPWQKRAFAYYDLVPEIKYAAQFYSRALSVLRLYVGERQDDGTIEESENPDAIAMLDRVKDPGGGGREGLLATYGRLMFIAGEAYLFVTKDEDGAEEWEMLSMDEIKPEGAGYVRYRAPSLQPEQFKEPSEDDYEPVDSSVAVVYHLWRRHPRFSMLPDATMQGVLDVCEELVLLTQAVRARARSRLAGSGILLVNGKYIPLPPDGAPSEDPNSDPFMRDFTNAMTSPIVNEGSPSSVVPHVVRIDSDDNLDNVMKHIQILDPMQTYPETGLRREQIERLAIGLDMPAEILTGLADSNHWNAWQIDEQTWKGHLQPIANQLVADLTGAFFQPSLRADGVADWERYVIAYDATAVINHPDRGKDAMDAYNARAIGKSALRLAKGFADEDAPTEEELNEMLGVATRDASLAKYGIPSVRGGTIETSAGVVEDVSGGNDAGAADAPAPTQGGDVSKTPPATPENVVGGAYRILGATDVAFWRAREIAGARLRNYARKDRDAEKVIEGVFPRDIAATLGPDLARKVGAPSARVLVDGAAEILAQTLDAWGVDATVAARLGDRLEQFAAQTLFDVRPAPLPQAFSNYVAGIANGNGNGKPKP